MDKDEKLDEGQILVRSIIEVAGKPKEHVEETLKGLIKKMKDNKKYDLSEEQVESAEEHEGFFSAFAEVEFFVKKLEHVTDFCFEYMPANVEIIEPEEIILENNTFTGFINNLMAMVHDLNRTTIESRGLSSAHIKNAAVLLRNFIVVLLSQSPKSTIEMQKYLGVHQQDIEKVLEVLIKEGKVKKDKDKYFVVVKK